MKRQLAAIPLHQPERIHYLRLKRVEAIQPYCDQFVEQLVDLAARMNHHELTRALDLAVHPRKLRRDEFSPDPRAHLQAALLSPVVA